YERLYWRLDLWIADYILVMMEMVVIEMVASLLWGQSAIRALSLTALREASQQDKFIWEKQNNKVKILFFKKDVAFSKTKTGSFLSIVIHSVFFQFLAFSFASSPSLCLVGKEEDSSGSPTGAKLTYCLLFDYLLFHLKEYYFISAEVVIFVMIIFLLKKDNTICKYEIFLHFKVVVYS
ncbi:hypothetical protein RFI_38103, partial [Reticulomyxa filosa]